MAVKQKPGYYERFMAAARDREAQAVELRAAGLTLEQIGEKLGVTRQAVFIMLQRAKRAADGKIPQS